MPVNKQPHKMIKIIFRCKLLVQLIAVSLHNRLHQLPFLVQPKVAPHNNRLLWHPRMHKLIVQLLTIRHRLTLYHRLIVVVQFNLLLQPANQIWHQAHKRKLWRIVPYGQLQAIQPTTVRTFKTRLLRLQQYNVRRSHTTLSRKQHWLSSLSSVDCFSSSSDT